MRTLRIFSLCLFQILAFSQSPAKRVVQAKLDANRKIGELILPLGASEWRVIPLSKKVRVTTGNDSRVFFTLNSYGPLETDGIFYDEFLSPLNSNTKPYSVHPVNPEKADYQELGAWKWWEISIPWVSQGSGAYPIFVLVLHTPTDAWTFSDLNTIGPDDAGHAGLDLHGGLLLSYTVNFRPKSGDYWERPAQIHFHLQENMQIKTDRVFLSPIRE